MYNHLEEFGTSVETAEPSRRRPPTDIGAEFEDQVEKVGGRPEISKTQWTANEAVYVAVPPTRNKLPAGVYTVTIKNNIPVFVKQDLVVDDLMHFPDSLSDKVFNEISDFWSRGDVFKEYGFLHRRGYIFYGPQGSGKTAMVQQIIKSVVDKDGVVFICEHPGILVLGLTVFRGVEPNRPIVCVFEDIDSIIKNYGDDYLLALLDGENQIDKVLNIATTNYPEYLDKRIVARPRRFDRVIKVGMPNETIRREYFHHKLKIKEDELEKWVSATNEFSFAACAELVISVKCLGHDFDKAVEILSSLLSSKHSSSEFDSTEIGFAGKKANTGFGFRP
jgi:hypothetical protein